MRSLRWACRHHCWRIGNQSRQSVQGTENFKLRALDNIEVRGWTGNFLAGISSTKSPKHVQPLSTVPLLQLLQSCQLKPYRWRNITYLALLGRSSLFSSGTSFSSKKIRITFWFLANWAPDVFLQKVGPSKSVVKLGNKALSIWEFFSGSLGLL